MDTGRCASKLQEIRLPDVNSARTWTKNDLARGLQIAELVQQKQEVVASASEVAVVSQAFLCSYVSLTEPVDVDNQFL